MRLLLVALTLVVAAGNARLDRDALLAADRALSQATDFASGFTDDAWYLHPGAPLVRGKDAIRPASLTWTPAYAEVSADGTRGYTYGWTRLDTLPGKYLACWRRDGNRGWRVTAFARTAAGAPPPANSPQRAATPTPAVPGAADPGDLLRADSAFAAASIARGAKAAFLAFAAEEAITLGGAGSIHHGRDAIGAAFDGYPADGVLAWEPVWADIARSGDLGCTVGEASFTPPRSYSKYLTVWKRQPDGAWKFVADGGNARPAP
jgi:ketosteroid isomerase-like protein